MTKAELIRMLEGIDENEELTFVCVGTDYNGFREECAPNVDYVETTKAYKARMLEKKAKQVKQTTEWMEEEVAELKAEMLANNKPTKKAIARNRHLNELIEYYEAEIKENREWLANI